MTSRKNKRVFILNKAHLCIHSHVAYSMAQFTVEVPRVFQWGRILISALYCAVMLLRVYIVFPTVVFLTFDLQISLIRLLTLWPGMVSQSIDWPLPTVTPTYVPAHLIAHTHLPICMDTCMQVLSLRNVFVSMRLAIQSSTSLLSTILTMLTTSTRSKR